MPKSKIKKQVVETIYCSSTYYSSNFKCSSQQFNRKAQCEIRKAFDIIWHKACFAKQKTEMCCLSDMVAEKYVVESKLAGQDKIISVLQKLTKITKGIATGHTKIQISLIYIHFQKGVTLRP